MSSQLLTPADLAEHFGVTERTLLRWANQYAWPRTQIGRRLRWTPEQVDQIKRQHAVTPAGVKPADGRTARSARRAG
jgi:DNA-binding transcriptional MerR regulator